MSLHRPETHWPAVPFLLAGPHPLEQLRGGGLEPALHQRPVPPGLGCGALRFLRPFLWCYRACLAARPWLRAESGRAASDVCKDGLSGMFLRCRRAGPGQAERVTWCGLPSPALRRALPTAARGCVMKCVLPEWHPPIAGSFLGLHPTAPGPAVQRRRSIPSPLAARAGRMCPSCRRPQMVLAGL